MEEVAEHGDVGEMAPDGDGEAGWWWRDRGEEWRRIVIQTNHLWFVKLPHSLKADPFFSFRLSF